MAFDVDSFISGDEEKKPKAAGGGFDVDAFIGKPAKPSLQDALGDTPQFERPIKGEPAGEIDSKQFENPSVWQDVKNRVGGSFSNLKNTVTSGAGAIAEGVRHPIDTLTSPERRRELERGVGDVVTFGLANKAARWADPENFGPEAEARDRAAAPGFRAAGNLGGMFAPTPQSVLAGKVARTVAPELGVASAAARGAVNYEANAIPAAIAQAPSGHRMEAALDAASDPAGLALGAGVPAVVAGAGRAVSGLGKEAQGFARAIEETKGAKARKLLEERGGARVGLGSAGEGGVFDKELAGVGTGDRAQGIAASRGAKNVLDQIKADHKIETSKPYREMKEHIDNSMAGRMKRDVTDLVTTMQNAVDDLETPSHVRASLKETLAILDKHRELDPATGQMDGPVVLTERDLNGLRRELMRQAKIGTTDAPGAAEAPLRAAAFAAKNMVDDGPYARLNELFAEGAKRTGDRRKLLGLKEKPSKDAQVDVNKARLGLQRGEAESNSFTAGSMADRLEQLKIQNPAYARNIDLPALARARNDLTFGLAPHHGGLMARAGGEAMAGPATAWGMVTHPLATGAALALKNRTAIEGRVLPELGRNVLAPQGARLEGLGDRIQGRDASPGGLGRLGSTARADLARPMGQIEPPVLARLTQAARAGDGPGKLSQLALALGVPLPLAQRIATGGLAALAGD